VFVLNEGVEECLEDAATETDEDDRNKYNDVRWCKGVAEQAGSKNQPACTEAPGLAETGGREAARNEDRHEKTGADRLDSAALSETESELAGDAQQNDRRSDNARRVGEHTEGCSVVKAGKSKS
jgi:hypothetical protein